jgi:hypothetical protein
MVQTRSSASRPQAAALQASIQKKKATPVRRNTKLKRMNPAIRKQLVESGLFIIKHTPGELSVEGKHGCHTYGERVWRLPEGAVLDVIQICEQNPLTDLFDDPYHLWNAIHVFGSLKQTAKELATKIHAQLYNEFHTA